ncbi:MAG: hypothetical protein JO104_10200 [Candidatus Eremiobacteraeota bacterium]|nr:hypothetical protein [Candidatus Eremiobacteraeota bacterium]
MHRHRTPLRGVKATPRPKPGDPNYTAVNYSYAGHIGRIHEVVEIGGRSLAKLGFDDRKIVYYFLDDLELDKSGERRTFHDEEGDPRTRGSIAGSGPRTSDRPT